MIGASSDSDFVREREVGIKMAVESFRQSKTLLWDAKEEKVRNG